jgi:hypothetical protein
MSPVSIPFTRLWLPGRMLLLYTGKAIVNFNRTNV